MPEESMDLNADSTKLVSELDKAINAFTEFYQVIKLVNNEANKLNTSQGLEREAQKTKAIAKEQEKIAKDMLQNERNRQIELHKLAQKDVQTQTEIARNRQIESRQVIAKANADMRQATINRDIEAYKEAARIKLIAQERDVEARRELIRLQGISESRDIEARKELVSLQNIQRERDVADRKVKERAALAKQQAIEIRDIQSYEAGGKKKAISETRDVEARKELIAQQEIGKMRDLEARKELINQQIIAQNRQIATRDEIARAKEAMKQATMNRDIEAYKEAARLKDIAQGRDIEARKELVRLQSISEARDIEARKDLVLRQNIQQSRDLESYKNKERTRKEVEDARKLWADHEETLRRAELDRRRNASRPQGNLTNQQQIQQIADAQNSFIALQQQLSSKQLIQKGQSVTESVSTDRLAQALTNQINKVKTLTTTYNGLTEAGEHWTATVTTQNGKVVGFTKSLASQEEAVKRLYLSWESIVKMFSMQIAYQSVFGAVGQIQQSVEAAKQLQIQIAAIQTLSESKMGVDQWMTGIIGISNATGLLADDIAKGTYDTLSNQIADGAQSLTFMTNASKLAIATNSSLQDTINAVSSAMNSLGLGLEDQTRIQDVYFRMIDVGRIKMVDFANSIGRVLPGARQLGVNLEEVATVLATSTMAGVTAANAQTSLFNIFNRLLKPAGEMSKFLDSIGVSSGAAAIETYKLMGVFNKIAQFAQDKPELIAELFPDQRGLRLALDMTGDRLVEYNKTLEKITNSMGAVNKAHEYFVDNPGKRFQVQMNKITNYFTTDFGATFLNALKWISHDTEIAYLGLKAMGDAAIYVGGPAVLAALLRFVTTTKAAQTAWLAFSTSPAGILLAGIAAAGIAYKQMNDYLEEAADKAAERQKALWRLQDAETAAFVAKQAKYLDDAISKSTQELRQYVAFFNTLYNKMAGDLVTANETILDNFKNLNNALLDAVKDTMQKFKDDLKDVNDQLKIITNFAKEAPEKLRKLQIGWKIEDTENPVEKQKLMMAELQRSFDMIKTAATADERKTAYEQYIEQLKELRKLHKDTNKDNKKDSEEAQKALDAKMKAEARIKELQDKGAIAVLKNQEKAATLAKNGTVVTKDGRVIGTDRKTSIAAKTEQLDEEKRTRQIREQQQIIKKSDETLARISKSKLVNLNYEEQANEALRLTLELNNKQATILTANKKRLMEIIDEYELTVKAITNGAAEIERFKFDKVLDANDADFKKKIDEQFAAIARQREFVNKYAKDDFALKKQLLENLDAQETKLKEAQVLRDKRRASEAARKVIETLEIQQKKQRDELVKQQKAQLTLAKEMGSNLQEVTKTTNLSTLRDKTPAAANDKSFDVLMAEIINRLNRMQKNPTIEGAIELKDMLGTYQAWMLKAGVSTKALEQAGLYRLLAALQPIIDKQAEIDATKAAMDTLANQVKEQTRAVADSLILDNLILEAANKNLEKQEDIKTLLARLSTIMESMQNGISVTVIQEQINSKAQTKAFGGMMHGSDNIPALLSKGEFVVNAAATRKFYSQLVSMNSVKGYAQGGYVSNVGDINVSLHSTGNTQSDIVAIGKGLRREIRRGRLRF